MPYHEMNPQHENPHFRLLSILQECEVVCEYTEATLLMSGAAQHRVEQLRLLRDCADICAHTSRSIARNSVFAKPTAALCAQICDVCGNHCLRHPDELSQNCGRICLRCAEECRRFSRAM